MVIPARNEAAVLTTSIERLMGLDYPPDRLRVYVVDDAGTDDTPAVLAACAARFPGRAAVPGRPARVLTEELLARCGGLPPVWADPVALADETEADRVHERRLWVGLAVAVAVVVVLHLVRTAVLGA